MDMYRYVCPCEHTHTHTRGSLGSRLSVTDRYKAVGGA